MSAENWHEERDRLIELLQAIESGKVTHVNEEDLRQGVAQRFNGKQAANIEASTVTTDSVTSSRSES